MAKFRSDVFMIEASILYFKRISIYKKAHCIKTYNSFSPIKNIMILDTVFSLCANHHILFENMRNLG